MKMEVISWHEVLTVYIKQHYAGKDVLVIFQDAANSPKEFYALMHDLDMMCLAPPHAFRGSGYLIIEMDEMDAKKLLDKHKTTSFLMELFSDGVCVYDNWDGPY